MKSTVKNENTGSGTEFSNSQQATDKAKNEKIREEQQSEKIDPSQANREKARTYKTDVSKKKTGGGKQINPGT